MAETFRTQPQYHVSPKNVHTADTGMVVQFGPCLLVRPGRVAVAPAVLLECGSIRGKPDVHADFAGVSCARAGCSIIESAIREGRVRVIAVAVVVPVPAGLHSNLISVVGGKIGGGQWSFHPDISCVEIRHLL